MTMDEEIVLMAYRRIKARGHGGLQVEVMNGKMVKCWETVKNDLGIKPLKEAAE